MGIDPCTCCCCCKICNWCLPETVYLQIINVVVPECDGSNLPNNCGCNEVHDLLEHSVGIPIISTSAAACNEWDASNDTGECVENCTDPAADPPPSPSAAKWTATGIWTGSPCGDPWAVRKFNCECVVPYPTGDPIPLPNYQATLSAFGVNNGAYDNFCVKAGSVEGDPDKKGLHIFLHFRGEYSTTILGEKSCCWEYLAPCTGEFTEYPFGFVVDTFYDSNSVLPFAVVGLPAGCEGRNAIWSTAGPVCDENGHFVSQTWHIESAGGIEFDVVVYA